MIFRAIWDPHLYDPSMARPETPTTRARWDARRAEVIERAAQICDQLMEPLLAETEELLATDAPATEQLRDLVRCWVANVVDHQDHMLVFQQERHLIDHGSQWREVRESRKRFERLVEDVLARAGAETDGPAVDPRLQLSALLGMVNHTAQWYRPRGRLSPEEIADGYVA